MPSYLIPTNNDYLDAHGQLEEEVIYKEKLAKLSNDEYKWKFETVKGFFKQADSSTKDLEFNYASDNFGRLKSWEDIQSSIKKLNEESSDNECYKLIFFARHGQGFHNLCVEKYGLEMWHEKYHSETTDGEITWAPDPMLTELGIKQAEENHDAWQRELALGAPIPSKYYVSPLQRSMWTLFHTWDGLRPETRNAVVTESIRETIGVNLCDKRSSKTVIKERFDKLGFLADNITEEDDLYSDDLRESLSDQSIRVNGFLQKLFEEDWDGEKLDPKKVEANSVISTTSHAGTIRCFITVLGHRRFTISTGGMIPIVVKATRT